MIGNRYLSDSASEFILINFGKRMGNGVAPCPYRILTSKVGTVILSAAKNLPRHTEILRCAQNDRVFPILVGNSHQGESTHVTPFARQKSSGQYAIISLYILREVTGCLLKP